MKINTKYTAGKLSPHAPQFLPCLASVFSVTVTCLCSYVLFALHIFNLKN